METAAGEAADAAEALRGLPAQLETHAGFSEVLASLAAGQAGTLGGVWGSSRALVAAALGRHCPQTLTVVLPHAAEVDSLVDDLALFTGVEAEAFPATEADAGERVVRDENFGQRQRLIKRLVGGSSPRIIVTSIQSLLQPLPSVEQLAAATQRIAVGKRLDLAAFTHWLAARGCQGTTAVELAGEFSLRGGILDVFPPDATLWPSCDR